jgi:hypothetical protein
LGQYFCPNQGYKPHVPGRAHLQVES